MANDEQHLSSTSNERLTREDFSAINVPNIYDDLGLYYEELMEGDEGRIKSVEWAISELSKSTKRDSSARQFVVDLGCNTGRPVVSMFASSSQPTFECVGVDVSPGPIALGEKLVPSATFNVADIRTWSPPPQRLEEGGIDCIATFYVLNHLPYEDYISMLHKFHSWLRQGGILIFGNVANVNGKVKWLQRYDVCATSLSLEENKKALEDAGFELVRCWDEVFRSKAKDKSTGKPVNPKTNQFYWCKKR